MNTISIHKEDMAVEREWEKGVESREWGRKKEGRVRNRRGEATQFDVERVMSFSDLSQCPRHHEAARRVPGFIIGIYIKE